MSSSQKRRSSRTKRKPVLFEDTQEHTEEHTEMDKEDTPKEPTEEHTEMDKEDTPKEPTKHTEMQEDTWVARKREDDDLQAIIKAAEERFQHLAGSSVSAIRKARDEWLAGQKTEEDLAKLRAPGGIERQDLIKNKEFEVLSQLEEAVGEAEIKRTRAEKEEMVRKTNM
jgi:hypothetical protein